MPRETDLAKAIEDELAQLRAAHPQRRIEFVASGDNSGPWDGARIQQLVRNLVSNAITYGAPDSPVRVHLRGEQPEIQLEVSNTGSIDPSEIRQIFDPLRRGIRERTNHEARGGLGLGLFIVNEIAKAHGGDVEARCDGGQTIFVVRLPRRERTR